MGKKLLDLEVKKILPHVPQFVDFIDYNTPAILHPPFTYIFILSNYLTPYRPLIFTGGTAVVVHPPHSIPNQRKA